VPFSEIRRGAGDARADDARIDNAIASAEGGRPADVNNYDAKPAFVAAPEGRRRPAGPA
jgi:hypothetical protein